MFYANLSSAAFSNSGKVFMNITKQAFFKSIYWMIKVFQKGRIKNIETENLDITKGDTTMYTEEL